MGDNKTLPDAVKRWDENTVAKTINRFPERKETFGGGLTSGKHHLSRRLSGRVADHVLSSFR